MDARLVKALEILSHVLPGRYSTNRDQQGILCVQRTGDDKTEFIIGAEKESDLAQAVEIYIQGVLVERRRVSTFLLNSFLGAPPEGFGPVKH